MKKLFFLGLFTAANCLGATNADIASAGYISPVKSAQKLVKMNPTPENHFNLSLVYYSSGLFEESVEAAKLAVKLRPNYSEAYNLMGAGYNNMAMWDSAIKALESAIRINPNFTLAKNNLNHAKAMLKASPAGAAPAYISPLKAALKTATANPTPENYLNLSLAYYTAKLFEESAATAGKAIKLKPDYALAYNMLGVAYNSMQMWDEAIAALKKAVSINPDFQLAKNNLNWAQTRKKAGWGR